MSLAKALTKLDSISKYWEKDGKRPHWRTRYTVQQVKDYLDFAKKEMVDILSILHSLNYPSHKENQLVQSAIHELQQEMKRIEERYKLCQERPETEYSGFSAQLWLWTAAKNLKRLQEGKLRKGPRKVRTEE